MIDELNIIAMNYVKKNDIEAGFEILEWCEQISAPGVYGDFPMLMNFTFNNLGCLYRRTGQLVHALRYLEAALDVLIRINNQHSSSKTYLNLCAVLSQMGKYSSNYMTGIMKF